MPRSGPHSEETKEKIRAALTGKPLTEERKAKISAAKKGKPLTELQLAAQRKTVAGRIGTKHTEEAKAAIGAKHRGKVYGAETREKISTATRERYASMSRDEVLAASEPGRKAAGKKTAETSIEKAIQSVLDVVGIHYQTQVQIGPYRVDILIPDRMLVLECDGDYWHALPGRKESDTNRDAFLAGMGYKVVRLAERDIRKDANAALFASVTL